MSRVIKMPVSLSDLQSIVAIPENRDELVSDKTLWPHEAMTFVMQVYNCLKIVTFNHDTDVEGLFDVWGLAYMRDQIVPYAAIHLMAVRHKLIGSRCEPHIRDEKMITWFLELVNWHEFNVTGEFMDVNLIAQAIDTRWQMEKTK